MYAKATGIHSIRLNNPGLNLVLRHLQVEAVHQLLNDGELGFGFSHYEQIASLADLHDTAWAQILPEGGLKLLRLQILNIKDSIYKLFGFGL